MLRVPRYKNNLYVFRASATFNFFYSEWLKNLPIKYRCAQSNNRFLIFRRIALCHMAPYFKGALAGLSSLAFTTEEARSSGFLWVFMLSVTLRRPGQGRGVGGAREREITVTHRRSYQ